MTTSYDDFKSDITITPEQLKKILQWDKSTEYVAHILQNFQCFVGGGFALHCLHKENQFGDIDFFFSSEEEKEKALEYIKTVYLPFESDLQSQPYLGDTIRAHTFCVEGRIFQFIKAVHGDVKGVLETFDFENAKAALVWSPETKNYTLVYSLLLPALLENKKLKFRRQTHVHLNTLEDKRTFAVQNFSRLEKYLYKFPGGFWDEDSREHILQQYAFNLMYSKRLMCGALRRLLVAETTTLEELVLFYPLGGDFKKLFEARTRGEYMGTEIL